ncbi:anti-sigma factor antagonist [Mycobacterium sp.]|uniref:anti-sigma factor antagonist n=1 Tax=Mycobacterium sp. TaxID=1785 RepID=UPI003D6C549F
MTLSSTEAFASPAGTTRTANLQLDERGLLRVTTRRTRSAVIVSVAGEVDASNERAWAQLLSETAATTPAPGPFVVDLRDVDFIGCNALAVLARESELCRRRGIRLCLVCQQSIVPRAIAAAGLGRALPIYQAIETALSRVVRRIR